jgi:hypothetical protein
MGGLGTLVRSEIGRYRALAERAGDATSSGYTDFCLLIPDIDR